MLRFFSRRSRRKGRAGQKSLGATAQAATNPQTSTSNKSSKNHIVCKILLPDSSDLTIELPVLSSVPVRSRCVVQLCSRQFSTFLLQKKALGSELLDQVFYSLDLIEKDYFGLQFTDSMNVQHWLDATKPVKKQVKSECVLPPIDKSHAAL
jgi:hypothetical protein